MVYSHRLVQIKLQKLVNQFYTQLNLTLTRFRYLTCLYDFWKGTAKATSYGAGIIHFLGGIHEIYFPYVLMRPLLFIAVILGGMTGVATYQATGFGFKSPASPGSFIVYCLNAPRGEFLHMLLGVFLAALVSFVVAALIMKFTREPKQDLEAATAQMENTKGKNQALLLS